MNIIIDESIKFFLKDNSFLFYTFVNKMVNPVFSNEIKTAAVFFDYDSENFKFEINEEFWNNLNFFSKCFLISHEILHVFLKHGSRGKNFLYQFDKNNQNFQLLNICQDISINEMLLKELNFEKNFLNFDFDLCYVDTIFKSEDILNHNINTNESFEYYYYLYLEIYGQNVKENKQTLDDHTGLSDFDDNNQSSSPNNDDDYNESDDSNEYDDSNEGDNSNEGDESNEDDYSNEGNNSNNKNQSKNIIDILIDDFLDNNNIDENNFFYKESNLYNLNDITNYEIKKEKSLYDYFNLSIKTSILYKKTIFKKPSWFGYNRRLSNIISSIDKNITIPTIMEGKKYKNDIHKVLIYLDFSGSCQSYSISFLDLVINLPKDKFFIEIYNFADKVDSVSIDLINKNYSFKNVGYGTNIKEVLNHANKKNNTETYDCIFLLSDGLFTQLHENDFIHFKKWFFFISPIQNKYNLQNIPFSKHIYQIPKK